MSHPPGRRAGPARFGASLALALLGCGADPISWTLHRTITAPAGAVALTADGALHPDSLRRLATTVHAPPGAICPGSLRVARGGATLYGVWWAPRADSGARLLAARSADGGATWSAPAPVDTTDRAVNGCRREAAAIAADSASGYVHVAYALLAAEGPGLFFSHSMDNGITFHSPVPIFYGDRLGRTSVAADGDLVAVGFEDPNSRTPRVGLALSRTMGHIFELRLLPVSDDNGAASHPLTAVTGHRIAIAWEQRAVDADTAAALVVRAGVVR
ncbi:MAG: hypothetical protein JWN53_2200 [Gemmatimonadetes bacterium]|nr:hypothetical protein [Gemmatimonadota bacterium]